MTSDTPLWRCEWALCGRARVDLHHRSTQAHPVASVCIHGLKKDANMDSLGDVGLACPTWKGIREPTPKPKWQR